MLWLIKLSIILNNKLLRAYDIIFSLVLFFLLLPILFLLFIFCLAESGQPIFIQKRVGQFENLQYHEIQNYASRYAIISLSFGQKRLVTNFGIHKKAKTDELPQLINVSKRNDFIGPRPCLLNQLELIEERKNIFSKLSRITGLSQIRGIDMSNPKKLSESDYHMILNFKKIDY